MILDQNKKHQKFFEELAAIPHGSFHEQAYSAYLVAFAKQHGLRYVQDDMYNVIMYKDASDDRKDAAPLLLQAHMDMVCEKDKNTIHDFATDRLQLQIEDGWLKATGTTLGADDGAGIAYMLALLSEEGLSHPPLECVFTVQEEVGLFGALHLKKEQFRAKRMINLDDESGYATCTTSAGGMNVILQRHMGFQEHHTTGYQLVINGLSGGHSGAEIDKERGNANQLLARVLHQLALHAPLQLEEITGGLADNAIPREASALLCWEKELVEAKQIVKEMERVFQKELEFSDAGVSLQLEVCPIKRVMSAQDSLEIITLLLLLPCGLRHHSMSIAGLSVASSNIGVVRTMQDTITINCSLRGALESYIDTFALEMDTLAALYKFTTTHEARYPAWSYDANSEMRKSMQLVCERLTKKPLGIMATHGGLECGVFKMLEPDMDIVTLGPIMKDIHTPQEALLLSSFDEIYVFLITFIAALG